MSTRKKKLRIVNKFKFIRAIVIVCLMVFLLIKLICLCVGHIITICNNYEYLDNYEVESEIYTIEFKDEDDEIEYMEISNKPVNMSDEYYDYVVQASEDNNIPINVILAIMTNENQSYDTLARHKNTNGTYDMGLCQVNSRYYKDFGRTYNINNFDPYNPKQAIEFIAKHMKYLSEYGANEFNLNSEDSYIFAAGAYNRGLGNECKYRNMYDYKEKFINNYNAFSIL